MDLVDEYADAFHAAMLTSGGINFAGGLVAKAKKDAIRCALSPRETDAGPQVPLSARTGSVAEVDSRSGATVESATSTRAAPAASAPSGENVENK